MKVFMLGWEFPPFISGGLGTACYGLTKAMNNLGLKVTFCLPKMLEDKYTTHVKLLTPNALSPAISSRINKLTNVVFRTINSPLQPYSSPDVYQQRIEETLRQKQIDGNSVRTVGQFAESGDYSSDMYVEVHRYAAVAAQLAKNEDFDIIHAHDWMTYPAGIAVAAMSGKPLIVQVHSTEFDRSGEHVNQMIYNIEREGMRAADKIIAVSYFTRNIIISRYGISGDKVKVVDNIAESRQL